jgi:hypothetical protein
MIRKAMLIAVCVVLTRFESPMKAGNNAGVGQPAPSQSPYHFDSRISREVLERYLSRAVTMMDMDHSPERPEDIRMLTNIGAKFIGRVAFLWGNPDKDEEHFRHAKETADLVHHADPAMLLEACVFEAVFDGVNNLSIPAWVFEAFGVPPEQRRFRYKAMLYDDGKFREEWGSHGAVPDMSKLETRMWFYYRARRYIDAGYEAIHFGQVHLMDRNDPGHRNWIDMLTRVRDYGARHARRHLSLANAHTHGVVENGKLLFDFHEYPSRPQEVTGSPEKTILTVNSKPKIGTPHDEIYGDSKGGETPSGWETEHLPYLVELDNWGSSGKGGKPGVPWHVWGYDEISWFARQPHAYRNEWLRYAWKWLRDHDRNGWFEMPGQRELADPVNGVKVYYANTKSKTAPHGFGQEETIKAIWLHDLGD